MKGQIFSLDILLAVLLITVIIGFTAVHFERVYSNSDNLAYLEMKSLSEDWSQIAIRNLLVSNPSETVLDVSRMSDLESEMSNSLTYDYEVILSTGETIGTGCVEKSNVAVSTRPVFTSGSAEVQNITVKICV